MGAGREASSLLSPFVLQSRRRSFLAARCEPLPRRAWPSRPNNKKAAAEHTEIDGGTRKFLRGCFERFSRNLLFPTQRSRHLVARSIREEETILGSSGDFGKAALSAGAAPRICPVLFSSGVRTAPALLATESGIPFAPFASSTVGFSSGRRVPRAASAWSAMRTRMARSGANPTQRSRAGHARAARDKSHCPSARLTQMAMLYGDASGPHTAQSG